MTKQRKNALTKAFLFWNFIDPALRKRVTTDDSFKGEDGSSAQAVMFDCLVGVLGAGWVESAETGWVELGKGAVIERERLLVDADTGHDGPSW